MHPLVTSDGGEANACAAFAREREGGTRLKHVERVCASVCEQGKLAEQLAGFEGR
jgi:maltooligosyltrehalose synthase